MEGTDLAMLDLWTYADILSFGNNKYINGNGNIVGALYPIDNMYKSGVRTMILTPQFDYLDGGFNAVRLARTEEVCKRAEAEYPGLAVCIGSRIKYYGGMSAALRSGEARSISGSRYIVLEFDREATFNFMREGIDECFAAGYRPLIDNPLLYDCVDEDNLEDLVQCGAYTVWDMAVFEKKLHRGARKQLDKIMARGLVHFVSDGADAAAQADYAAAAENVAAMYGESEARRIFYDNYIEMINDGVNILPY